MVEKLESNLSSLNKIGISDFKERFPWIGGDLQTLRDTFRVDQLPSEVGKVIEIKVPETPGGICGKGNLLAIFDPPLNGLRPQALVLILHGLGGSSRRQGLRRMTFSLRKAGFATLRLNLRGADPSRNFAPGTYSAACISDIIPVIKRARQLCCEINKGLIDTNNDLPLYGVGISLGGTILLNACLKINGDIFNDNNRVLDALVCTSSPLDLAECSSSIERPRNMVYQRWLLKRLVRQTLSDPYSMAISESKIIDSWKKGYNLPSSIREFDQAITAPRWGYKNVNSYYENASPYSSIIGGTDLLPPTLFLQAKDDPWVPYYSVNRLLKRCYEINNCDVKVVLTPKGGHNGFHGKDGCWGDCLVRNWLGSLRI